MGSPRALERDVLKGVLEERGIEAVEAGSQIEPGKFAFCTKICSKIIVSQFSIVLLNNDAIGPNANVSIEYGLMLGHNKYVIPFQREAETLPFNVAGLDTVKYNQGNFRRLAIEAIEQAIRETSQNKPASNFDRILETFLIIKNVTIVNLQRSPGEQQIFDLGNPFGFNLVISFDGLNYIYLGIFGALRTSAVIWRLSKFSELLNARVNSIATRLEFGITDDRGAKMVDFFRTRVSVWLIVAEATDKDDINVWLEKQKVQFPVEIYTQKEVGDLVSQLPS